MGFAGTKLAISPPEVFIYLLKGKNPGSFLSFPEGEYVYIREKNFFSLSRKGRTGRQLFLFLIDSQDSLGSSSIAQISVSMR